MDRDDPEKRIAELERQLAAEKRGTDLPPASLDHAAVSGRFVAFPAPPGTKQMYKFMYGSIAAYTALIFVIGIASMTLGPRIGAVAYILPTVFAFGILVIGGIALFLRFPRFFGREDRRKQILICVTSDGLTVDQRPGDVFSFADAKLGIWILAGIVNLTMGAALHLQCGNHRFVVGGRDHRIANGTRLNAPPTGSVDAWMWTSDFAGLLAMVGRRSGLDVRGPAPGEPTRCLLYPNASRSFSYSGFGMFNNLGTYRQLQANPPQPGLAMDVGKDAIWVIDLNRNALIASAGLAQVTATAAENRTYVYRAGTWTTPVLVVRVAGLQPLTIGCPDSPDPAWPRVSYSAVGVKRNVSRFSWRGQVYQESQPDYLVSGADWLTLVEKLGLASYLEDTANRVRG
jgi:hypothetical protein